MMISMFVDELLSSSCHNCAFFINHHKGTIKYVSFHTSRTGPFTFLMIDLFGSSRNSTLT